MNLLRKLSQIVRDDVQRSMQRARDKRGFAIMYAFSAIMLITFIVMSLSKETLMDYRISTRSIDEVKAYYAAHSGIEISLLRIQIYRTALARFGQLLEDPKQKAMLDMVWSLPLPWPPVVGEEISKVDQDVIQSAVKESMMDISYIATVTDEGTKIDINDLASKSETLRDSTKQQVINLFVAKLENDTDFREKHRSVDFEEIVNNIADWIDEDEQSRNGGAESSDYDDLGLGDGETLPPNRAFRTIQELRMVAGMQDEFFDILEPRITVYGTKGINVNYASEEVLMSISSEMTQEKAKLIVSRRSDPVLGPFTSPEAFINYVSSELNITLESSGENAIPIQTDPVVNFRIESQGISRGTTREIVAVVYDFDKVRDRLVDFIQKENPQEDDASNGGTGSDSSQSDQANANPSDNAGSNTNADASANAGPRGRPKIVYWQIR